MYVSAYWLRRSSSICLKLTHLFHRRGEEGLAAGRFGHVRRRFCRRGPGWGYQFSADRVDDGLRPLALLDRLIRMHTALVVIPVGDRIIPPWDPAPVRARRLEAVAAGSVNRSEGRAPPGQHTVDPFRSAWTLLVQSASTVGVTSKPITKA